MEDTSSTVEYGYLHQTEFKHENLMDGFYFYSYITKILYTDICIKFADGTKGMQISVFHCT